jgi:hypothetical protein
MTLSKNTWMDQQRKITTSISFESTVNDFITQGELWSDDIHKRHATEGRKDELRCKGYDLKVYDETESKI